MGTDDIWVEENLTYISLTSTLARADTDAESQDARPPRKVSFFERVFRPSDIPAFEDSLRRQIKYEDEAEKFLQIYHRFNNKALYALMEKLLWYGNFVAKDSMQEGSSFPEQLSRESLKSRSTSSILRRNPAEKRIEKLQREKLKISFGELLLKFSETLATSPVNCSQLCILSSEVPSSHDAFSFSHKLKATLDRNYHEICDTPKLAVMYVLKMHWKLNDDVFEELLAAEPKEELEEEHHFLPSKVPTSIPIDVFKTSDHLRTTLTLSWFSHCPKYLGDLDTYVWQLYGAKPIPEYLKLFIATGSTERGIVLFKTETSAKNFRKLRLAMDDSMYVSEKEQWDPSFETAKTVVGLFKLVAESSEYFLLGMRKQISNLTYEGRKKPSGSKVQFILHMNDCRIGAIQGLHDCLRVLSETKQSLERHPSLTLQRQESLHNELGICKTDFHALIDAMEEAGHLMFDLRKMLNEQLNLTQLHRSGVLAILATLYVPLSYVSSLFGMNITPTSMGLDSIFTNMNGLDGDATLDFTALTPNQTEDLLTVLSNNGNYLWDFKWYWITTVPLIVVSIVLPILAGSIIRMTLQNFSRYRIYWRLLGVIIAILYIIGIYGFLYNYSLTHSGFHEIPKTIYQALAKGVYTVLAVCKVRSAFRKRSNRVKWCLWMVIVAACTIASLSFNNQDIKLGTNIKVNMWDITPWTVLAAFFVGPNLKRAAVRLRDKRRKTE